MVMRVPLLRDFYLQPITRKVINRFYLNFLLVKISLPEVQ